MKSNYKNLDVKVFAFFLLVNKDKCNPLPPWMGDLKAQGLRKDSGTIGLDPSLGGCLTNR